MKLAMITPDTNVAPKRSVFVQQTKEQFISFVFRILYGKG